jgi:hypothetical protein
MQKIMFNEQFGLQQATFDGTKTMTRRVVPDVILNYVPIYQQQYYEQTLSTISVEDAIMNMVGPEKMFQRYVYQVGEIVAIAQRYSQLEKEIEREGLPLNLQEWVYKHKGYNNKMFVRAEDMPHHIKIIDIKVEPLCGISDEDCLREGITTLKGGFRLQDAYSFKGDKVWWKTPYLAYKELIDRLNRRGFFETNPIVFVYTYELID